MDIPCPSSFSFEAAKWPQWKQRFERFRIASDLSSKPQARQVAMLLYSMGERAEEVFNSFTFADTESNENYTHVLAKFDAHFVVKHNVIFERAKFNMRRQAPQETADAFIVALHTLAETCNFGDLRDQLIRDRIVVGILDARLSERLQLDADLTLAKAVAMVRQSELVHQQQGLLRTTSAPTQNDNPEINAVAQHRKSTARRQPRDYKAVTPKPEVNQQPCKWCGKNPGHSRQQCPAQIKKVSCANCFRVGHYAKVCLSKKRPSPAEKPVQAVTSANSLFLDTISTADDSNNTWYAEIHVIGKPVRFRIDTGADVTATTSRRSVSRVARLPHDTNRRRLFASTVADGPSTSSGEARGFKVGGLRGRVREGCTPSRWGSGGCAPGKIFKLHMHAGEFKSNFHTKINTLTPVFMPLSFGKIFKLHMHAGEF
jgi:hypothetical protein